jgi:hypothetical protein
MRQFFIHLFASIFLAFSVHGQDRLSSAPFISGDTFRSFADYMYDETGSTVNPARVKYGDVIFVKGDLLGKFFKKVHPKIVSPYVLVVHNSDEAMPRPYETYLEDPKILRWFAQNVENFSHKKLANLPIGLANRYWTHGSIETVYKVLSMKDAIPKEHLLYLNIAVGTYVQERSHVFNLFKDKPYCYSPPLKSYEGYLTDLAKSAFVLSPRGNGIDCHRTWEALYMGSIPIVRKSSLDPLYVDLPVVIVDNWEEVDEQFLESTLEAFANREFSMEKLSANYWHQVFNQFKRKY